MDLAIFWLPILGATLIGIGGTIWWGNGNKGVALWVGIAGIVLLLFTLGLQVQKSIWQTEAKAKPLDVTQRPYISIAGIGFRYLRLSPGPAVIFWDIKNSGQSPATIVEANMTLWFGTNDAPLPVKPQYVPTSHTFAGTVIPPNGGILNANFQSERVLTADEVAHIEQGHSHMYAFGFVKYRDSAGTERVKGFIALYNPANDPRRGMFSYLLGNPNYEYGD